MLFLNFRPLSCLSHFQEDFEFDGQTQFQDPRNTSESTTPMEGENMGGWWPEHSTPDTGVRPARQLPLACTRSSAHSFGKCCFHHNAPNLLLLLLLTECWIVAVGWFCLLFFFQPASIVNGRPGLSVLGYCVEHTGISSVQLAFSCVLIFWLAIWTEAHLTRIKIRHSFIGFRFHQFTVFSLDTCMLVELASVCWDYSTEFLWDHINVGGTTSSVVSFVFFVLFHCLHVLLLFISSLPVFFKLLLVLKPKNTSAII